MCCFDFNGELFLGDLKTQSLNEIYSSKEFLRIKKAHEGFNKEGLLCDSCDQLIETKDIMLYNSRFAINKRIHQLSTTFREIE